MINDDGVWFAGWNKNDDEWRGGCRRAVPFVRARNEECSRVTDAAARLSSLGLASKLTWKNPPYEILEETEMFMPVCFVYYEEQCAAMLHSLDATRIG